MTAALELPADDVIAELWRRGELAWKLDPHQLRVYEKYRLWEQRRPANDNAGEMRRVFVFDISRRWGKTFLCLAIKFEDCLRQPGSIHTYATAFQKDIADIVIPMYLDMCRDAPDDVEPNFQQSKEGLSMGLFFPNGSVLRLVGIDKNPKGLRGRHSNGFAVSEAGHVARLKSTMANIVYPQFQRQPQARLILESNAPEDPDHDFDRYFVEDAKKRDAYVFQDIDDNEALSEEEKAEFTVAAGLKPGCPHVSAPGVKHPECQCAPGGLREYYGVRIRDAERVVLPEFDEMRHVVPPGTVPAYAHCYEGMDPGTRDKFGIVWAFWDFERAKLVVQRSYAESNVTTTPIADMLKTTERDLWGELTYWNGQKFKTNPYLRVSDTDARVICDLSAEHGISVVPTAKDDAEAQLYALRNAFLNDKIEIWEDSGPLAAQCKAAIYNEKRTEWERSEVHGHWDCVSALIYLWRNVVRTLNPFPPQHVGKDMHEHHMAGFAAQKPKTSAAKALERAFANGNRFRPQQGRRMR